jgi:hypothetical protein
MKPEGKRDDMAVQVILDCFKIGLILRFEISLDIPSCQYVAFKKVAHVHEHIPRLSFLSNFRYI